MLRSISAQSSTKVIPVAATATGPIWVTTFCRFCFFKNVSVTRLKKITIASSVSSGASIRACRLAHRNTRFHAASPTRRSSSGAPTPCGICCSIDSPLVRQQTADSRQKRLDGGLPGTLRASGTKRLLSAVCCPLSPSGVAQQQILADALAGEFLGDAAFGHDEDAVGLG